MNEVDKLVVRLSWQIVQLELELTRAKEQLEGLERENARLRMENLGPAVPPGQIPPQ